MSKTRILKVKLVTDKNKKTNEKKIHIVYECQNMRAGWDEFSMTCAEEARPEFYNALHDLRWHVTEQCELPNDDVEIAKITVTGVSFSYAGENETMGATIIAQRELAESLTNLNLNTPHKAEEFYADEGDERQLMSSECAEDLRKLQSEVIEYVKGNRLQLDLFKSKAA